MLHFEMSFVTPSCDKEIQEEYFASLFLSSPCVQNLFLVCFVWKDGQPKLQNSNSMPIYWSSKKLSLYVTVCLFQQTVQEVHL